MEQIYSLIIQDKGGEPPTPISSLNGDVLLDNGNPISLKFSQLNNLEQQPNITSKVQPVKTSQGDIYPARGVIIEEDGTVILTAYAENQLNQRLPNTFSSCTSKKP